MDQLRQVLSIIYHMSFREHLRYWILPLGIVFCFLCMFCFGPLWMQDFVSPAFNREFGILENSATLVVGAMVLYSVKCWLRSKGVFDRLIFGAVMLISAWLFLEELDYGLHFYELINHIPESEKVINRNFHNQDLAVLHNMKTFIYLFIMVIFVLIPLIGPKPFPPYFKKFIASPKMILPAISLEIISISAHAFVYTWNHHGNNSLDGNISEFGEGLIYYILLLYLIEVYQNQKKISI